MTKTNDINTDKVIRLTDNTPKKEDDYQARDQFSRPMTDDEIKQKVSELSKD